MNANRSFRSSKAFTLIELLIVITIIGILAVALLPRITAGPSKARDAQRKADLQQIATALTLYADDNSGRYPWYSTSTTAAGCIATYATYLAPTSSTAASYMVSVPTDPKTSATKTCTTGGYGYLPTTDGFILEAALENAGATGTGIYETSTFYSKLSSSSKTSVNSGNAASQLCGASSSIACASNGATYLIFR